LDEAFKELDGWNHFHTDSLRGRTLSLQLRPTEAWDYFLKAESRADDFQKTSRNILRRFVLKIFCLENCFVEESLPNLGDPRKAKAIYKEILEFDAPNLEFARNYKNFARALYALHNKNYSVAIKTLNWLLRDTKKSIGDEKTGFYLAASVAYRGNGDETTSDKLLEYACLSIPTLENKFNMGLFSGVVIALLQLWGRDEEAQEWDSFLTNLRISEKATNIFRERSKRMLERSASLNRVFIF
jgi:tetratricopeptide (TPR) repeat protein